MMFIASMIMAMMILTNAATVCNYLEPGSEVFNVDVQAALDDFRTKLSELGWGSVEILEGTLNLGMHFRRRPEPESRGGIGSPERDRLYMHLHI